MKRILLLLLLILNLFAIPAFAEIENQDDTTAWEDSSAGGATASAPAGPKLDPSIDIGNWLGRAGAPALQKSQRKPLKALYEKEVKAMEKPFQERFGVTLRSALAALAVPVRTRRFAPKVDPELTTEVQRIANLLSDKLIATLPMEQQAPLRKYQSELVRVKKVELMKQTMASSGISLSPQQEAQIDAIYARESYLRTQAIIEANGESYDKTLSILARLTKQRAEEVLDQSQRSVLSARNTPKAQQQNP